MTRLPVALALALLAPALMAGCLRPAPAGAADDAGGQPWEPFTSGGAALVGAHAWATCGFCSPADAPVYRAFVAFANQRAILVHFDARDGGEPLRVHPNVTYDRGELAWLFSAGGADLRSVFPNTANGTIVVERVHTGHLPDDAYGELAAALTRNWTDAPSGGSTVATDYPGVGTYWKAQANLTLDAVRDPFVLPHDQPAAPDGPATAKFQRVIQAFDAAEDAFVSASDGSATTTSAPAATGDPECDWQGADAPGEAEAAADGRNLTVRLTNWSNRTACVVVSLNGTAAARLAAAPGTSPGWHQTANLTWDGEWVTVEAVDRTTGQREAARVDLAEAPHVVVSLTAEGMALDVRGERPAFM